MTATLIIAAAGLGTRLGCDGPKLLVEVDGRPMLDHLLELYAQVVERFVLVVSPRHLDAVRRHCATRPQPIELTTQPRPTGMLDAVLAPSAWLRSRSPASVWITWCDQIGVHPSTVQRLAALARPTEVALIFPTIQRATPYVHMARDAQGEIVDVLHRREGDVMPAVGETDIGLFGLSPQAYFEALTEFAALDVSGRLTGERNFLPFLPWLARRARVRTFSAHEEIEAVGINTPTDLALVAEHLRRRRTAAPRQ